MTEGASGAVPHAEQLAGIALVLGPLPGIAGLRAVLLAHFGRRRPTLGQQRRPSGLGRVGPDHHRRFGRCGLDGRRREPDIEGVAQLVPGFCQWHAVIVAQELDDHVRMGGRGMPSLTPRVRHFLRGRGGHGAQALVGLRDKKEALIGLSVPGAFHDASGGRVYAARQESIGEDPQPLHQAVGQGRPAKHHAEHDATALGCRRPGQRSKRARAVAEFGVGHQLHRHPLVRLMRHRVHVVLLVAGRGAPRAVTMRPSCANLMHLTRPSKANNCNYQLAKKAPFSTRL